MKVLGKIKTHILCSMNSPSPPKNCAVYNITWKNTVEKDKSQTTV